MAEIDRRNLSNAASFTAQSLDNPFASGSFRWVAKGTYTDGPRIGEPCVCKWFKTGAVFENSFFDIDIRAVDTALQLVMQFNEEQLVNKIVRLNVPSVWIFQPGSGRDRVGSKVLIEPFIENYQKFNSNTGWSDSATPCYASSEKWS